MPFTKRAGLSIIVVTYARTASCLRCLASVIAACGNISPSDVEIIVGVNGPDPHTNDLLETFKRNRPYKIIVKKYKTREMPSAIRNKLILEASQSWLFFIDDDASVSAGIFEQFFKSQSNYSEAVAFGGPNLNPPGSLLFQRASGLALSSRFGTYFSFIRYRSVGNPKECGEEALILCNLFVRRDVLGESPFPVNFRCCEENWLLQDLKTHGYKLIYDPGLVVWHERRANFKALSSQIFHYGYGRGQLLKNKPKGLHPIYFFPTTFLFYSLSMVFLIMNNALNLWFVFPLCLYLTFCFIVPAAHFIKTRESLAAASLSAGIFPLVHVSYGVGLFWGLIRG